MYEYAAVVHSSVASADGTVHLDCIVNRRLEGTEDPWEPVPNGHRTVVLSAAELRTILDSGGSANQKRQAIISLLRQYIKGWGIDEADRAEQDMMDLIPSGSWPVTVTL